MANKSFFRRMAEEKGLMNEEITVTFQGVTHFMTTENVIDLIEQAPKHEQDHIKKTFSQIDYLNGDLSHYIRFLGEAFIKFNY